MGKVRKSTGGYFLTFSLVMPHLQTIIVSKDSENLDQSGHVSSRAGNHEMPMTSDPSEGSALTILQPRDDQLIVSVSSFQLNIFLQDLQMTLFCFDVVVSYFFET